MGTHHPALHSKQFLTSRPHWIANIPHEIINGDVLNCQFTFQHTHALVSCRVVQTQNGLVVRLAADTRALTEGQFAVFYRNNECLGSAKILAVAPTNYTLEWLNRNPISSSENVNVENKNAAKKNKVHAAAS